VDFSPGGDPMSASIGVYTFGSDNVLLPEVAYTQGEILPDPDVPLPGARPVQKGAGDGTLTIATYLPATGNLAFLGPPETAGVKLAIQDIEAAGGIPGVDSIVLIEGDSGDVSTTTGQQTLKRLLAKKPDVLIGAASSASTLAALDQVTSAGILMISPANSAPALSTAPDKGLYWRTSPSDVLQGAVVGAEVLNDGHAKVAVLSRQDVYGDGLNANITKAITDRGGEVVANVVYDPSSTDFAADVAKVKAAAPDAIVLIGFGESTLIIQELAKQGIGPNAVG
jgi:ABC-type branched-subunit amino acid transport system substrate-binding protein